MNKISTSKTWTTNLKKFIAAICLLICSYNFAQPTWSVLATPAPDFSGGLMLLLSDGSVLCKTTNGGTDGVGSVWDRLTPNSSGSYINGTWSTIAPMNDTRLYVSSQTLKDGRIYVAGGEYGTGGSKGEIYDPVLNSWTPVPISGAYYGDANSAILDNGKILQATLVQPFNQTLIYDPVTNTYANGPTCLGGHDESTWMKLQDNSILFVNVGSTSSERYIPSLNQWIPDANVPVNLYDPFGSETGPGFMLPDGRVFFLGSMGNTALYTPSGNNSPGSWAAGPSLPGGNGCPDAAGAMMVDGKIIFSAAPIPISSASLFLTPTSFYEYDYLTNLITAVSAPGGGPTINTACYVTTMLDLPDGNVMLAFQGSKSYYMHKPAGAPLAAGKPTITAVAQNGCTNTFTLTGLLFNGICEGASYGDDWQMNSNYPIVRLTSGTNVYYARTFNWNRTAIRTGTLPDTTLFTLPGNIPNGTYSLSVSANGNSSDPITFTFTPFPALTSALTAPNICSGSSFSYNAVPNMTGTTMQWTRAAIAGISNAAITTPQSTDPNEVLINTGTTAKTVLYSYTLTNGSCVTYYQVSVVVKPNQSLTVTGPNLICQGDQTVITAHGLTTYSWSTAVFASSITVSPMVTTVYTVSGTNSYGCFCLRQATVTIDPLPTLTLSGTQLICIGDTTILNAAGDGNSYYWNNTAQTSNSISVSPSVTTTYSIVSFGLNGCQRRDSIKVTVSACLGLKENKSTNIKSIVYPNPFHDKLSLECEIKNAGLYLFKLYDVFGRIVKEEQFEWSTGFNKKEFEWNALSNGVYMLIVKKDSEIITTRVIKE